MQARKSQDPLVAVPLDKILMKCNKEEVDEEEQPIYINWEEETIKCKWCSLFKGSIEARVINQHMKTAKTHIRERQRHLQPHELADPLEGVQDIRSYFQPS